MKSKLCAGIIAQVDAGKTTLCESVLFLTNIIRKKGRVDSGNSFFDFNPSEIRHGITVFSKEATIQWKNAEITILDSPGHRDFKSEVDRILPVIDVVVFVISAVELEKPQDRYLFEQIATYDKPIILFISKMDMGRISITDVQKQLSRSYSDKCVAYKFGRFSLEELATIDEYFFNAYLTNEPVSNEYLRTSIIKCAIYPYICGSGLLGEGVEDLLNLLSELAYHPDDSIVSGPQDAYVFKIDRDNKGTRQTHVRVLSGCFNVRDEISFPELNTCSIEKIIEIRKLNGSRNINVSSASVGDVVVFSGISSSRIGDHLGSYCHNETACLNSQNNIMYSVLYPHHISKSKVLDAIKLIEEEDPAITFDIPNNAEEEIRVNLQGDLQSDLLKEVFTERFNIPVTFGKPQVIYYETILNSVKGNGHFEPLRHFAEVCVSISPMPAGSGIVIENACSDNSLNSNWQSSILYWLKATEFRGVLTGSPLADIKITLIGGRGHIKHTEGGDFREATVRAVRQGLMKAESVLLEPYASYNISCNTSLASKIQSDLDLNHISIQKQFIDNTSLFVISGIGPLAAIDKLRKIYLMEKGDAILFEYSPIGFFPCIGADKVIAEKHYNPCSDISQSPDSVYCCHGAGHIVKWYDVDELMHADNIDSCNNSTEILNRPLSETEFTDILRRNSLLDKNPSLYQRTSPLIMPDTKYSPAQTLYLIDGNNLLFAYIDSIVGKSDDLGRYTSIYRNNMITDLINYFKYIDAFVRVVFDGYNEDDLKQFNLDGSLSFLYAGRESADVVLERMANVIGPNYNCKIVTSDRMIQIAALQSGIVRISSYEFLEEMRTGIKKLRDQLRNKNVAIHNRVFDQGVNV